MSKTRQPNFAFKRSSASKKRLVEGERKLGLQHREATKVYTDFPAVIVGEDGKLRFASKL